jgi:hypothetical protein
MWCENVSSVQIKDCSSVSLILTDDKKRCQKLPSLAQSIVWFKIVKKSALVAVFAAYRHTHFTCYSSVIEIVPSESNLRSSISGWVGGGLWKPTRQPRGIIPIRRNQSQHFETLALKWVITKVKIPNSAAPTVLFCSPNLGLINGLVPPVFRLLSCTAIPYMLQNTAVKDQAILYVCLCIWYTLYTCMAL